MLITEACNFDLANIGGRERLARSDKVSTLIQAACPMRPEIVAKRWLVALVE
jgi:hypothetical protein